MFVDKTRIFLKAGNGGDGSISFLRDRTTMTGGPDGGNGGKGGDIIFITDEGNNNLVDFYYTKHFRAENGENGSHLKCNGKAGKDIIIRVPQGTVVKDAENGNVVADMFEKDKKVVILKGGEGGRGNAMFANSRRQSPAFAETGEKTKEYAVDLELKTIADVGLIGFPSVGKSKILSKLTSAKPKIADYHFTTLTPNLGVASYGGQNFMMADIPGLIEGASDGKGLGFEFLRHVERTRMLLHVVDIAGVDYRDPLEDFVVINKELEKYSKQLSKVPQVVVLNKIDLLNGDFSKVEEFKKKYGKKYTIIPFSAATLENKNELLQTIVKTLSTLKPLEPIKADTFSLDKRDFTKYEIVRDSSGAFEIKGDLIDDLIRGIILEEPESLAYFQKRLKWSGVHDKLVEMGVKEGDIVRIGAFEFEFFE
ncbi:MAG: GTPase ObgE [Clostridiales bacterium]|nr:GTPase ObgE [Candidatus Apopatousia equi]